MRRPAGCSANSGPHGSSRPPAASVAAKLEESLEAGTPLQTTLEERRELLAALERGAARPRSGELRTLEVELYAAVSERYRSES
jgi:hypothetical protein